MVFKFFPVFFLFLFLFTFTHLICSQNTTEKTRKIHPKTQPKSPEIWQKQSIHLTIVFGLLTLFLFIYISCRPLLDKNNNNNNNNQNDNQQQQIFLKIKNSFYWFDAILLIIFVSKNFLQNQSIKNR